MKTRTRPNPVMTDSVSNSFPIESTQALWRENDVNCLEQAIFRTEADSSFLDGIVLGYRSGLPIRVRYQLRFDFSWALREATIQSLKGGGESLALRADGAGNWLGSDFLPLEEFQGCRDFMLHPSPAFLGVLAKRWNLKSAQEETFPVIYSSFETLKLSQDSATLKCLRRTLSTAEFMFHLHGRTEKPFRFHTNREGTVVGVHERFDQVGPKTVKSEMKKKESKPLDFQIKILGPVKE